MSGSLDTIHFTLDGEPVTAEPGESLLQVALRLGKAVPHLCFREGQRADGNCRACMVEIEGERTLAASCRRQPASDMVVWSDNERARKSQKMVLELLRTDSDTGGDSELDHWCDALDVGRSRFPAAGRPTIDQSHPAIIFDPAACIHCTRCLRACRETQVNDVIGFAHRGLSSAIVFDGGDPLGQSSCVACGECVQACPTPALRPAGVASMPSARDIDSLCPYCGVGCQLTFHVAENRILSVTGRNGPANQGRLCVKGRYGFDYISHRERLTRPLIRKPGAAKTAELEVDPEDPYRHFREASWEEALAVAADGLLGIRQQHGGRSLAGFGSAKGSNEEAYLFQKLVRTGFGSNHVDHCTRLCHASSVAALLQMIGSGAVSNPVVDVADTDVIVVIGSNTTENHPVAATFMKNAAKNGKTLIVMDPRSTPLARHATFNLRFRPDTDVAMLNALMQTVIEEELLDTDFIEARTEGFEQLKTHLQAFSPERVAPICGIDAETLRQVARCYATAERAMIFWGMGISQHVHGTDNARCLINLALLCGQIGRPATGLHPLRGQNNVQGASDAGLIPMVFPDYRPVTSDTARQDLESLWGARLDGEPGLTVVEIMNAALRGEIRGMYIMGENPAMSDPNLHHSRKALAALDHLVVQDIFMTETAHYADVILPASAFAEKSGTFTNADRRVQMARAAVNPPGEARQDLEIIQSMARRMGLSWKYDGPQAVFDEMRKAMPSIAGITWQRLESEGAVTYPCRKEGDPGEPVIFTREFPTPSGRATLIPADYTQANELPDQEYDWVLITGRQLEHWHTGAMTRRASILDRLEPTPVASLNEVSLARLNLHEGGKITIRSRRGSVTAEVRRDNGLQDQQVFLPFCYSEAAANLLTNDALDPDGKIPEFKFCAVQVVPESSV